MLNKIFTKTINEDIVVIDSIFPQKTPRAFRNSEINEYFKRIKNFSSYTMYPMKPDKGAWFQHGYGINEKTFKENKKGYLKTYPQNRRRVKYLYPRKKYKIKLAYSFFLAETYTLLPFYERQEIPFIFVLYPGGGFGLNFDKSDLMLKKIFSSHLFRGVIVTQPITRDYLLKKKMCSKDKIHYIYGGFVQFKKEEIKEKLLYKENKKSFDICFVAKKYTEKGVDKGYDLFVETARRLVKATDDIFFHVVGGFGPEDIDVDAFKDRIKFYGYQGPDSLKEFYSRMDIFLSPNRPFRLFKGNFDGFPLGGDAAYCGVARFVSNELNIETKFKDGSDIAVIPLSAEKIADIILTYYNDVDALYVLSKNGQRITQELLDINYQIQRRIEVFDKFIKLESQ